MAWRIGAASDRRRALVSPGPEPPSPEVRGLPRERPGGSLERPDEISDDPAAIEVALLRLDQFVPHPGGVDPARVERHVIAQRLVRRRRIRISPGDRPRKPAVNDRVEVPGDALE